LYELITDPKLSFHLFDSPVIRALGYLHRRCLWLVCPTGELEPAFAAFPDTGTLPLDGLHVALGAAVKSA
jgi:hypothetical protein